LVKTTKKGRVIFTFIKCIILICFLFALYFQLKRVPDLGINKLVFQAHYFLLAIALTPLNWYVEWKKWLLTLKENNLAQKNALTPFFTGMISGFLTPGFPGNFLGRIYYYEKSKRIKLSAYIQISNFSQLLTSLIFGYIALLVLWNNNLVNELNELPKTYTFAIIVAIFLIIFLLALKKQAVQLITKGFLLKTKIDIKGIFRFLYKLVIASTLRHFIFSLQFLLILLAFGIDFNVYLVLWIWLSYFVVTLTPTLLFGKIIVRDSITIAVFELGGYEVLPVLISSISIWIVNVLSPTVIAWYKLKLQNE